MKRLTDRFARMKAALGEGTSVRKPVEDGYEENTEKEGAMLFLARSEATIGLQSDAFCGV